MTSTRALKLHKSQTDVAKPGVPRTRLLIAFCTCLVAQLVPSLSFALEHRTALIIGNSSYTDSPLKNPRNDAADMAEALESIGFDVTLAVDANRREMGRSIRDFGRRLRDKGGVGLFYYAGHGMQIDNRNYMIPIDSPMQEEDEVPYESVDVGSVLSKMETAGNALNVIILDACRNNPFPNRFRSSSRGLARVEAPIGSLIVYATAPGSVAADGNGRNGVFTGHLLEQLRTPGLTLSETVRRTRAAVVRSTGRAQVPWESSSLLTDIAFTRPTPEPSPEQPSQPSLAAVPNNKPEETSTVATLPVPEPSPEPTALAVAPNVRSLTVSVVPAEARIRIMNIVEKYQPGIELPANRAYDVLVTHAGFKPWRRSIMLDEQENRVAVQLEPVTIVAEAAVNTVDEKAADALVRRTTKDLPLLASQPNMPALNTISGGTFRMGCSKGDRTCESFEKPAVSIFVPAYRIGQTEVTVAQFKRFAAATGYTTDAEKNAGGFKGCHIYQDKSGISRASSGWVWREGKNWKDPGYQQSDEHPVTCVSWNDAQAYVEWLSAVTGIAYRLPSEAEWEYAARAGVETRYLLGNDPKKQCRMGNAADRTRSPKGSNWANGINCVDKHWYSAPVASFESNSFGLHDMQGNVWEWVVDTWMPGFTGVESARVNLDGDRSKRVLRGGGWASEAPQQRLSARGLGDVSSRSSMIGFRVVSGSR